MPLQTLWVTLASADAVASDVALVTVVDVVTVATVVTVGAAVAVAVGAEGRTMRRSGSLAPSWAVWFSR